MDKHDMPETPAPKLDAFWQLVEALNEVIRPTSGREFDEVDKDRIMKLMEEYKSDENHWGKYVVENENKVVTRNLIDKGDNKHNLVGSTL